MTRPFLSLAVALLIPPAVADAVDAVRQARLPAGLELILFADDISQARGLAVAEDGTVAVGSAGRAVHLLRDEDGDGQADWHASIDGFRLPSGVAWLGPDLFVGEIKQVVRLRDVRAALAAGAEPERETIISGLHNSSHHGRRVLGLSPDGKLYLALGVPCNICAPPDPDLTGTIREHDLATGATRTFARGLRNSVGFDWHPVTGELWATDNGRDWLGDDAPHDELNRIHQAGLHFGFPYCHQGDLADPEFGDQRGCDEFEPPAINLGPHVAALGMRFLPADFPIAPGTALVALHGSWNRSEKIGYEVVKVGFSADGTSASGVEPFITGWLVDGDVHARPVDVLPFGAAVLVSDDHNDAVYLVRQATGR